MTEPYLFAIYCLPMVLILLAYSRRRVRQQQSNLAAKEAAVQSGLTEPVSLHPSVDPNKCVGCKACVAACPEMPEHHVLGLINGKAELINPTDCIGHGACFSACPVGAITLVFGSERRGVDIPVLRPDFRTNVPGIYIAGELGGMGLIRNAIEQGRQAMDSIHKLGGQRAGEILDVLIVGAGPAGFSASLAATEYGLRFVTVEQESLGGAVAHYPRGKIVMTAPARLPIVGEVQLRETSKEALLRFWKDVEAKTKLSIRYGERLESIEKAPGGFVARTSRGAYQTRTVLLAIGRRGTPQKLGVPGEELPKTTYRLIEPEQYEGRRILVVGGGDSAIEAACALAEVGGTDVTLSYRSAAFSRAKAKNRDRIQSAANQGKVNVLLQSTVMAIEPEAVHLRHDDRGLALPNDAVIVNAGGVLPTGFLRTLGVEVETKYGTA